MILKDSFFCVEQENERNGLPVFSIRLNPSHTIFKAHFPGSPIVPGVCQIQILSELMEMYSGRKLYLKEVKNIKFLSVLDPIQTSCLEVDFQKITIDMESLKTTALLQTAMKQYAKISLMYLFEPI
ncbi:beta-hydroxyacyl-ACP dehydratase [Parabacteroides sp.]